MKKILIPILLLSSLLTPTVASAATVNIASAQATAITCWSNHTKSVACTKALNTVKAWKPTKSSDALTVNQNVLIKCLYAGTTKTTACKNAASYVAKQQKTASDLAQIKNDIHQIQGALIMGIGSGDLTTSDNTGATALTGDISSEGSDAPVGNAVVYVSVDLTQGTGSYCISETIGSLTYKATSANGSIVAGTPCSSVRS